MQTTVEASPAPTTFVVPAVSFRVHRLFVALSLAVIGIAFSYPVFFVLTTGAWKTVRHAYSSPYPLLTAHAVLGFLIVASFLVQFELAARGVVAPLVHRALGLAYLFGLGPSFSATALYIAVNNEIGFDDVSVYLIAFAVLGYQAFAVLGYVAIRRHDVVAHLDWMVLSFMLITIAALVRVVLYADAAFGLHMVGWQYRGLTVVLMLAQLHAFAVLRGRHHAVRGPLMAISLGFLGILAVAS